MHKIRSISTQQLRGTSGGKENQMLENHLFLGKQDSDSLDCDHMEIDLVMLQIPGLCVRLTAGQKHAGLLLVASMSLTWPQFRLGYPSLLLYVYLIQSAHVVS